MARKPRIHYPGAIYHVMLRGNGGMKIFFLDEDRHYFYSLIQEGIDRYEYQIHAFCFMHNHVHLVLRVGNICLSKIIQNISFRYTRWINKRMKRYGHLFQGRYKAILVDGDSYLLTLVRYVHLNPIRADLIDKIENYPWCSHRVYIGLDVIPWVTTDLVLSYFGNERHFALSAYQKFMVSDNNEEKNNIFLSGNQVGGSILAEDDFIKKMNLHSLVKSNAKVNLDHLVKVVCSYYDMDEAILAQQNQSSAKIRAMIALLAQEINGSTFTLVAEYFKRDVTGLIRKIRQLRKNKEIIDELGELREYIKMSACQA